MIITDGTGDGFSAGISSKHRLLVDADSHDAILTAAASGKAFRFDSGLIALTSANSSALLYLKNNEADNLILAEIVIRMNQSTGGANGIGLIEVLRNPTGGTIVTAAVAATVRANTNFGSTSTILADVYKGAEGNSFSDGTIYANVNGVPVPNRVFVIEATGVILARGTSIGIRYTPPAGNTALLVSAEIGAYLDSETFATF